MWSRRGEGGGDGADLFGGGPVVAEAVVLADDLCL